MNKKELTLEELIGQIITVPFLYGIQSEFITDQDELYHRLAAFKASGYYKEPKEAILKLLDQRK